MNGKKSATTHYTRMRNTLNALMKSIYLSQANECSSTSDREKSEFVLSACIALGEKLIKLVSSFARLIDQLSTVILNQQQ